MVGGARITACCTAVVGINIVIIVGVVIILVAAVAGVGVLRPKTEVELGGEPFLFAILAHENFPSMQFFARQLHDSTRRHL